MPRGLDKVNRTGLPPEAFALAGAPGGLSEVHRERVSSAEPDLRLAQTAKTRSVLQDITLQAAKLGGKTALAGVQTARAAVTGSAKLAGRAVTAVGSQVAQGAQSLYGRAESSGLIKGGAAVAGTIALGPAYAALDEAFDVSGKLEAGIGKVGAGLKAAGGGILSMFKREKPEDEGPVTPTEPVEVPTAVSVDLPLVDGVTGGVSATEIVEPITTGLLEQTATLQAAITRSQEASTAVDAEQTTVLQGMAKLDKREADALRRARLKGVSDVSLGGLTGMATGGGRGEDGDGDGPAGVFGKVLGTVSGAAGLLGTKFLGVGKILGPLKGGLAKLSTGLVSIGKNVVGLIGRGGPLAARGAIAAAGVVKTGAIATAGAAKGLAGAAITGIAVPVAAITAGAVVGGVVGKKMFDAGMANEGTKTGVLLGGGGRTLAKLTGVERRGREAAEAIVLPKDAGAQAMRVLGPAFATGGPEGLRERFVKFPPEKQEAVLTFLRKPTAPAHMKEMLSILTTGSPSATTTTGPAVAPVTSTTAVSLGTPTPVLSTTAISAEAVTKITAQRPAVMPTPTRAEMVIERAEPVVSDTTDNMLQTLQITSGNLAKSIQALAASLVAQAQAGGGDSGSKRVTGLDQFSPTLHNSGAL